MSTSHNAAIMHYGKALCLESVQRTLTRESPMKIVFETERLILREFVDDDAEAFHAFNSDPEVMRYTDDVYTESVDQARRMIRTYPDYRRHGYGRWAVVYKPDRRMIGFSGLKFLEDLQETDLGYRFLPEYWGRGIATEAGLASVRHGFDVLELTRIIGLVLPENIGSIRVLEKVGMSFDGMLDYCGVRAQRWVLERGD